MKGEVYGKRELSPLVGQQKKGGQQRREKQRRGDNRRPENQQ
jgi:small subunit ribosomal protein S3